MKPKILYSYDEWIIKQNERYSRGLSSNIEEMREDTANRMLLVMKSATTELNEYEKEWCRKYDIQYNIGRIEREYTDKIHSITHLFLMLDGLNCKRRKPIYTKIGKLQCRILKLEIEYETGNNNLLGN